MLTQEEVKTWFNYNPISGKLTWAKAGVRRRKGEEAGSINSHGYRVVGLNRKVHKVHKVIMCYMTGEWPSQDITVDHINGNRLDNRWVNLRLLSKQGNSANRTRANVNNTIGHLGVRVKGNRYDVYVGENRIGTAASVQDAIQMQQDYKQGKQVTTKKHVKKSRSDSASGVTGVKVRHGVRGDTYTVRTVSKGVYKYVGSFKTLEEAQKAYAAAIGVDAS